MFARLLIAWNNCKSSTSELAEADNLPVNTGTKVDVEGELSESFPEGSTQPAERFAALLAFTWEE